MIKKILPKILWALAGVAFALVLTVAAVAICAVRLLKSEQLTPIVCSLAEDNLDATVDIGAIRLSFNPGYPILRLDVHDVEIVSHSLERLPDSVRRGLPAYADTLLRVGRLSGAIDVGKLLVGNEISLHGLEIERPEVNIVITPTAANFDIYRSEPDIVAKDTKTALPAISIDRFAFIEPRDIRFFNAIDSTEATVVLLSTASVDGSSSPDYALKIDGELHGPIAESLLEAEGFGFGVDGKVRWEPSRPELLAVEEMRLRGAFLEAVVDAAVSFTDKMTVESGRIAVESLDVSAALAALGSETLKKYRLTAPTFATDARLGLEGRLLRPFCFETDTLPYAELRAKVGDCHLRYGAARFHDLALEAKMSLAGTNLDSAEVTVEKFTVAGPATSLKIAGRAWRLLSDPTFEVNVEGRCDIRNLPPQLADAAQGYLGGELLADLKFNGAMSMFSPGRFHELCAEGSLKGRNLYYLSNDTSKMADVPHVAVVFDSRKAVTTPDGSRKILLSAKIEADTASLLLGGVSLRAGGFALGAAALNTSYYADTTMVLPVGGGIKLRNFSVRSITDSAGMSLRNLEGRMMLNRYKDDKHLPRISLSGTAGRLVAGSKTTVFLLSDANISASTHKIPEREAMRRAIRAVADSIGRAHPHLSPDSVMRLAIEKRLHRPHRRRVTVTETDEQEMIDWGASSSLKRYLTDWALEGNISTARARLYTPYFPLRNRIDRLDIWFNTDSIELRGVEYRAGKSDLAVTGLVSNVKRALTSRRRNGVLKANFTITSDTIDVNEIAGAVFAGSAYAEQHRRGEVKTFDMSDDDDSDFAEQLDALASQRADTVGPLLLPVNVDARIGLRASNILYSDLHMHDLSGELLMFDGALNVNRLTAVSDAGSLDISALYSAPNPQQMKFGFGMMLDNFKIEKFLSLVPTIDSIMPLMRDFSGVIDANLAATVDIDSAMNFVLPTLDAAVKLSGDSLALINPDTYRTLGKWLRFRDRADNKIKHMSVEMIVKDNRLELFPFTFDIDRYRLGVVGSNDLALNFNYHIAVLKSPIPFKFGITIKGNPDDYKVRFGGAKFNDKDAATNVAVVDTARINLVRQIQNVFRRGVRNSDFASLKNLKRPDLSALEEKDGELTPADSIALIKEGILEAPADSLAVPAEAAASKKGKK